jgi:hypothetical protein
MGLLRGRDGVISDELVPIAAAATRAVHDFFPLMLPSGAPSEGALADGAEFRG